MKELFFGWLTKGQHNLSFLDSIIGIIEIFVGIFLIFLILYVILTVKEKFKHRKEK